MAEGSNGALVLCCGCGRYGQLGVGSYLVHCEQPTLLEGINRVSGITAGGNHSMFFTDDGRIFASGMDVGEMNCSPTEVQVRTKSKVVQCTASSASSYVRFGDGKVAWLHDPMTFLDVEHAVYIDSSCDSIAILDNTGKVHIFSDSRQIDADVLPSPYKADVCACGGNSFIIVLSKSGSAFMRVVAETGFGMCDFPVREWIHLMDDILDISAGADHAVIVSKDGRVHGVGNSRVGQLGKRGYAMEWEDISDPFTALLQPDEKINHVTCGARSTILTTTQGRALGCGSCCHVELGSISPVVANTTPIIVPGLEEWFVLEASAGGGHSIFLVRERQTSSC